MSVPRIATVSARAALAGNPSDLYDGAVLAIPVRSLSARVEVRPSNAITVEPESALIRAAMARLQETGDVRWSTVIPRSVGLAGSSALVIGVLRACGATDDPLEMAQLALGIERDDVGIVAGLQDRAVQAFDAPCLVDVANETPVVSPLSPAQQLRFVVAWSTGASGDSGVYHERVAASVDRGGMRELADIGRAAAAAFSAGNAGSLARHMADSAAVRARVAPLSTQHERLANAVSSVGLVPNSAGSGGAVVAVTEDRSVLEPLRATLRVIGGDCVVERFG